MVGLNYGVFERSLLKVNFASHDAAGFMSLPMSHCLCCLAHVPVTVSHSTLIYSKSRFCSDVSLSEIGPLKIANHNLSSL